MSLDQLIACHDCDLLQQRRALRDGEVARCARCQAFLYRRKPRSLDRALALSLAALILFILANTFPFLSMQVQGREQFITLPSAVGSLLAGNQWLLAACVGFLILLAPLLKLLSLLYVLIPLRLGKRVPHSSRYYRLARQIAPWNMVEVYLIGTLVALVKLAELATIVLGISFWSFVGLIICETAAGIALDGVALWSSLEREA
jgi:paraquat-inducible protein A